jgi:hypothetical protein
MFRMLRYTLRYPECRHPVLGANDAIDLRTWEEITVLPGEKVLVDLGVTFRFPPNVCGFICVHPHFARLYNIQICNPLVGKNKLNACLYRVRCQSGSSRCFTGTHMEQEEKEKHNSIKVHFQSGEKEALTIKPHLPWFQLVLFSTYRPGELLEESLPTNEEGAAAALAAGSGSRVDVIPHDEPPAVPASQAPPEPPMEV